ncbi:KAP family P-loop NTPase fold protein [Vogesella urethralis]|uniref:KAP family P-loop NTPase fold protein n=1 Tax=Vogesella urethralis TaxID=2592656 RepID=UPI001185CBC9|nr:P-loop NTPase fold protein [Vogesella urethralis]
MEIKSAKHSEWLKTHSWDKCSLGLENLGRFLSSYIRTERDGFVLSLNGAWGSGKTEFLKRIYVELLNKNHPVLYINSWESDFTGDPLRVIASEMIGQLKKLAEKEFSDGKFDRAKKLFGTILKGSAVSIAYVASKSLLGEGDILKTPVERLVDAEPIELTTAISDEYEKQVESIAEIRKALSDFAIAIKDVELPVVVLVDELDRCRPDYAIKMLESIKHFFNTKNFVFIVANDTKQLCSSIKVLYGSDFDSDSYLKRFFDRSFRLPEPNLIKYAAIKYPNFDRPLKYAKFDIFDENLPIDELFGALFYFYDMKLRDVDQFFAKFKACISHIEGMGQSSSKSYYFSRTVLAIAICMQDKATKSFSDQTCFGSLNMGNGRSSKIWGGIDLERLMGLISDLYFVRVSSNGRFSSYSLIDFDAASAWENDLVRKGFTNISQGLKKQCSLIFGPDGRATVTMANDSCKYTLKSGETFFLWDDYKRVVELSGHLD